MDIKVLMLTHKMGRRKPTSAVCVQLWGIGRSRARIDMTARKIIPGAIDSHTLQLLGVNLSFVQQTPLSILLSPSHTNFTFIMSYPTLHLRAEVSTHDSIFKTLHVTNAVL